MIRKALKVLALVLALAFIAIQFIRPSFVNPPIVPGETLQATTEVPGDVQQILARSCNDCHSNETAYPWYSKITPFNWFLADHIDEGRHEMNFSKWGTFTKEQKMNKLDEICEVVQEGTMPLPSYLWIHRDAVLSKGDAEMLCTWAKSESTRIENTPRSTQ